MMSHGAPSIAAAIKSGADRIHFPGATPAACSTISDKTNVVQPAQKSHQTIGSKKQTCALSKSDSAQAFKKSESNKYDGPLFQHLASRYSDARKVEEDDEWVFV